LGHDRLTKAAFACLSDGVDVACSRLLGRGKSDGIDRRRSSEIYERA
jgi:hypothetical protein